MLHARIILGMALLATLLLASASAQEKAKDPPRQIEGIVKKVDAQGPQASSLTITVRERQPTDMEDVFKEVEKDRTFRVTEATRILGMNGKPEKDGLKGLKAQQRVRVEHRKDLALEVKVLPPK